MENKKPVLRAVAPMDMQARRDYQVAVAKHVREGIMGALGAILCIEGAGGAFAPNAVAAAREALQRAGELTYEALEANRQAAIFMIYELENEEKKDA